MADEEVPQEKTGAENETSNSSEKKSKLPWILLGVIVPLFIGSGFFLGRIVAAKMGGPEGAGAVQEEEEKPDYVEMLLTHAKETDTWVFDVPPSVANLMDPGARRYLRVAFKLEMNGQFDASAGAEHMTKNLHKITNWIMIYFSNLTVVELQGEKNLNRVLMQVKDGLNELLFPGVKPLIVTAFFSERAIQ